MKIVIVRLSLLVYIPSLAYKNYLFTQNALDTSIALESCLI